jgi:hypothetical protein
MSEEERRRGLDAVTVGQIRKRYSHTLEMEIANLTRIIRQGYFKLPEAENYLKETIAKTLSAMQNIDAMASTEVLFQAEKQPPPNPKARQT